MGRQWFVTADTERLELGDGQWIEVKKALSFGEQEALTNSALGRARGAGDSQEFSIQMDVFNVNRLVTWLTDWSLRDARDKPVKLTRDAIKALHPAAAAELSAALDKHIEALAADPKAIASAD